MNVLWIGHRLGILLLAVTAIEPVAALWWWAVFGMSEPVATAHIFTPFVTFGAGCTLVMFCDSPGTFRSGAEPRDIEAPSQIGRQNTGRAMTLTPPADLVMIVDRNNTAHVLLPRDRRPDFRPTLCGGQRNDLAAIPHDVQDTLAARWDLLTDRQFRAWPPWPCQTCVGITQRDPSSSRDEDREPSKTVVFGSDAVPRSPETRDV